MNGNRFKLANQLRKAHSIASAITARTAYAALDAAEFDIASKRIVAELAGVTFPSDETWELVVALLIAFETSPAGERAMAVHR